MLVSRPGSPRLQGACGRRRYPGAALLFVYGILVLLLVPWNPATISARPTGLPTGPFDDGPPELGQRASSTVRSPAAAPPDVTSISVGGSPTSIVYDHLDGRMFVSHVGTDNVTVVDTASQRPIASIPVIGDSLPGSEAIDPATGTVYVTTWWLQICTGCSETSVTAFNGTDLSVRASYNVSTLGFPVVFSCVGFDPVSRLLYVCADGLTSQLLVLDPANLTVDRTITTGGYPDAVAFDTSSGTGYAANFASNDVTVFQMQSGHVLGTIAVGNGPSAIAYDNRSGQLYVANNGTANITVINGQTSAVVGSIPVGNCPSAEAYDWIDDALFVANSCSDNVTWVDPGTGAPAGSIATGVYPCGVAVDRTNGYLYIANEGSGNLSAVSTSFVRIPTRYDVVFHESGLAAGTDWSVNFSGATTHASDPNISFMEPNGTYTYTVGPLGGWRLPFGQWNGSVSVSGNGAVVSLEWFIATYPVVFNESGLPAGTSWSVAIGGSNHTLAFPQIVFQLANGTYAYTASGPGDSSFRPAPASGEVRLNGSGAYISIEFVPGSAAANEPLSEYWMALGGSIGLAVGCLVLGALYLTSSGPSSARRR